MVSLTRSFITVTFFILCFISFSSSALEVSPLVHKLTSQGRGTSGQLLIRNTSDQKLPIEVAVSRIVFDEVGNQQLIPIEDEILVLPPALYIEAGAIQKVRLLWVGQSFIRKSQSYFVHLTQPDIYSSSADKSSNVNAIKLNLTFNVLVHVADQEFDNQNKEDALHVNTTEVFKDNDLTEQHNYLALNISNQGNRYRYLSDYVMTVFSDSQPIYQLTQGELRELGHDSFLPPKVTRDLRIPIPNDISIMLPSDEFANKDIHVEFSMESP